MKTTWIQPAIPVVTAILVTGCAIPLPTGHARFQADEGEGMRHGGMAVCTGCSDCKVANVPDGDRVYEKRPDAAYDESNGILPALMVNFRANRPTLHWRRVVPDSKYPFTTRDRHANHASGNKLTWHTVAGATSHD